MKLTEVPQLTEKKKIFVNMEMDITQNETPFIVSSWCQSIR